MKNSRVRAVAAGLVLALVPRMVAAQRPKPGDDTHAPMSHCQAAAVWCLFGSAGECSATCTNSKATCVGGSCILGFPSAPSCSCV